MDATPVIARGKSAAALVPPVTEAALPYIQAAPPGRILVLLADADRAVSLAESAAAWAASNARSLIGVSGLSRAAKRLAASPPDVVAAGIADALSLIKRSVLRPAEFTTIIIAWPEQLDDSGASALETVMAELDRDAQRIILTAEAGPSTDQLIERYTFKAMTYGFPPHDAPAPGPVGPARYVISRHFKEARRRILDALAPDTDEAVVIARCPESREAASLLVQPVIVIEPHQLPWLRRLYSPLSPLPLPAALDALERRSDTVRAKLIATVERENLDRELFIISPLLERYDAAEVAAAALRLMGSHAGSPMQETAGNAPAGGATTVHPAWSKLWVGVGRRDGAKPGDLVGAIVNEAKVPADAVGRIDVRDLFCLVDVASEHAEAVVRALTGTTLRGRRVVARVDRGAGPGSHRPPRRV